MYEELENFIGIDEKILYKGKPDKKSYIYKSLVNMFLTISIIGIIINIFAFRNYEVKVRCVFFIISVVCPFLIYLSSVFVSNKKYQNTKWIITDKAIYISSGFLRYSIVRKSFAEISNIKLIRGILDEKLNTGNILIDTDIIETDGTPFCIYIESIREYKLIYDMIKKLQLDVSSDVMYPNDLRSAENHGYNEEYKGL